MSDRTRSFFVPCCELSDSSQQSGARAPTNSAAAYLILPSPRSASRTEASGQPCIDRVASQAHATQNPEHEDCRPAVSARLSVG